MRVTLLAFGMLRELLGPVTGAVELRDDATVADLIESCQAALPGSSFPFSAIAVAVNREYVPASHRLDEGDEVALLPPVSGGREGGAGGTGGAGEKIALTDAVIDGEGLIASMKAGEDGAVVVFDGIVRNNTRGRRTLYLFYEAYAEMALEQMRQLAEQAREKFPVREVAIVHRVGRLEIGESSVLIVVASAHRGAAFDACRWVIDTLKQTVPIWKKEFFEDGAVWAQGEPFPAALAAQPGSGQGSEAGSAAGRAG